MALIGAELITDHIEFTEVPSAGDESGCLRSKHRADQATKGFRDSAAVQIQEGVGDKLWAPPEHT